MRFADAAILGGILWGNCPVKRTPATEIHKHLNSYTFYTYLLLPNIYLHSPTLVDSQAIEQSLCQRFNPPPNSASCPEAQGCGTVAVCAIAAFASNAATTTAAFETASLPFDESKGTAIPRLSVRVPRFSQNQLERDFLESAIKCQAHRVPGLVLVHHGADILGIADLLAVDGHNQITA